MSAVRWWTPSDIFQVTRTMDRLFDEALGAGGSPGPATGGGNGQGVPTFALPVDVRETEEAYLLTASVPGFTPEQVEVTFEGGVLSITATAQALEIPGRWIRQERPFGTWHRRLEMPQQVVAEKIVADFENGELTVTVPKLARPQPLKISVGNKQKAIKG